MAAESSLKAELEARLKNEYESEVRDTIQALIASLQDVSNDSPSTTSSTSPSGENEKGKAKADGTSETPTKATVTSLDILKSMEQVRNIEAAFVVLESDFVFPSQLDFNHGVRSPFNTPTSSDTEGSATSRLAYTSHNHPVRFYEQALGALMAQLDAVESFGNEELRSSRKEVVERVERALEELEREVEGRWKAKLSREEKSKASEPIPAATATSSSPAGLSQPAAEATDTSGSATGDFTADSQLSQPALSTESAPTSPPTLATDSLDAISEVVDSATGTGPSDSEAGRPDTETIETSPSYTEVPITPSSPLLAASEVTVKGVPLAEEVAIDTFLLPVITDDELPKRKEADGDTGSEWSEVEA